MHGLWLKDFLVFLVAAGLVVPLFHRARIGAVLGFLLIGVAVGPSGLGQLAGEFPWIRYLTIEDRARVEPFADLGVMFLLFMIGLELSIARLWTLRRVLFGIGGVQFFVSAAAIGAAAGLAGLGTASSIVLGLCLAMSSTAIVMQLLEEQGRSATPVGQVAIALLLFQDLMVAPVLFGTELLGRGGERVLVDLAIALLHAAAAVGVLAIVGFFLLRPLFRLAGRTGSRELIMAMALAVVVVLAGVTGYFGLSTSLGAFLAGVLLSETEYRHQIEIDIAPVKGLLLGLFFITVGMSIDVQAAWAKLTVILLAVAGLCLFKVLVTFAAARWFAVPRPVAAESAILLAQGGEFGFVVIALATGSGLLPANAAQFVTVVIGLSMMATPLFAALGRNAARWLAPLDHKVSAPQGDGSEFANHVIIGGFGRVGQMIARALEAENVPYVCLDADGDSVARMREHNRPVYFGDAARPELLEKVGGARARAFVVTLNNTRAAERMVRAARRINGRALIFARAADIAHAARLVRLGAIGVIPETVEASLQLTARVLEGLDMPDDAVVQRVAAMRAVEIARLDEAEMAGRMSR